MNKDKLLKASNEALERLINAYAIRGVTLNNKPEIVYLNKASIKYSDTIALVKSELDNTSETVNSLINELGKKVNESMLNIKLTNQGFNELNENKTIIRKKETEDEIILEENKLYLLSHARKLDFVDLNLVIAHELWHLIEHERGLMKLTPFIAEGTATYATQKLFNQECNDSIIDGFNSLKDLTFLIYYGTAHIVSEHVKNEKSKHLAALNQEIRFSIQNDFINQTSQAFAKLLDNKAYTKYLINQARLDMMKNPELQTLYVNPSKESIIEYYTKKGALNLVNELKEQDLSGMISYYRKITRK